MQPFCSACSSTSLYKSTSISTEYSQYSDVARGTRMNAHINTTSCHAWYAATPAFGAQTKSGGVAVPSRKASCHAAYECSHATVTR